MYKVSSGWGAGRWGPDDPCSFAQPFAGYGRTLTLTLSLRTWRGGSTQPPIVSRPRRAGPQPRRLRGLCGQEYDSPCVIPDSGDTLPLHLEAVNYAHTVSSVA
jgi:hypothetical protein